MSCCCCWIEYLPWRGKVSLVALGSWRCHCAGGQVSNDGREKQAVIIILYYIQVTIRSRYILHRSSEKTARHHERSADMLHPAAHSQWDRWDDQKAQRKLQMLMLRDSEFCPRSCLGCRYRCRWIENENDDAETIYIQMLLCGPTLIIIYYTRNINIILQLPLQ